MGAEWEANFAKRQTRLAVNDVLVLVAEVALAHVHYELSESKQATTQSDLQSISIAVKIAGNAATDSAQATRFQSAVAHRTSGARSRSCADPWPRCCESHRPINPTVQNQHRETGSKNAGLVQGWLTGPAS
jgi:hypothetical protein